MNQQEQQQGSFWLKPKEGFDILSWAVAIHSACIYPFTRSGMGVRGMGVPGFFAALLILVYAGSTNSPEMVTFFYAWLGMVAWRRIRADRRQHSRYVGWPWLMSLVLFGCKREFLLRRIEPLLVGAVGWLLCPWSEPMGMFLIAACISMSMKAGLDNMLVEAQAQAMHDAEVEMEATLQQRRNAKK